MRICFDKQNQQEFKVLDAETRENKKCINKKFNQSLGVNIDCESRKNQSAISLDVSKWGQAMKTITKIFSMFWLKENK